MLLLLRRFCLIMLKKTRIWSVFVLMLNITSPPTMPVRINNTHSTKIGAIATRTMCRPKGKRKMIVILYCACVTKDMMTIIAHMHSGICFCITTCWTLSIYSHIFFCRIISHPAPSGLVLDYFTKIQNME